MKKALFAAITVLLLAMAFRTASALTIETGVSLSESGWNHTVDKVHVTDKQGNERVYSLVESNGIGEGSDLGGGICQLTWKNGAADRVCNGRIADLAEAVRGGAARDARASGPGRGPGSPCRPTRTRVDRVGERRRPGGR